MVPACKAGATTHATPARGQMSSGLRWRCDALPHRALEVMRAFVDPAGREAAPSSDEHARRGAA